MGDEVATVTRQRVVTAPEPIFSPPNDTPLGRAHTRSAHDECDKGPEEHGPRKPGTEPVKRIILRRSPKNPAVKKGRKRHRLFSSDDVWTKISTVAPSQPEEQSVEAVIDTIVEYDDIIDQFKVISEGYPASEATWEPPGHLPYSTMIARIVPEHIHEYCN